MLNGGGIRVVHYDIFSGPGLVANELAGREKLCSIYRVLWQRGTNYVWFGGNHGFAFGRADYEGDPGCNGQLWCSGNLEHVHPGVNDRHGWLITGEYYGIAVDTWPHADKAGDTTKARTYYGKVVAIAGDADKTRTEVADARAFLRNP